ncbi:6-phosphofructokinase, alpha subunit [Polyrhizophydium stewartii]|uniref:ATP-dependent 6-phosphofructokinase n=1 Tax=Polyrhizophydium stewartii TaxID=2732419 RepID=A0ABR4NHB8_9FUNG
MSSPTHAVSVPSREALDSCIKFYSDLGFKLVSVSPEPGIPGAFMRLALSSAATPVLPPMAVDISVAPNAAAQAPSHADVAVSLVVEDVEAVKKALSKSSVPFTVRPASQSPSPDAVIATDPAGNKLLITEVPPAFRSHGTPASAAAADASARSLPDLRLSTSVAPAPSLPSGVHPTFSRSKTQKRIGILTSGGDSSGMNASVRAITRVALQRGCIPFAIYEGYQGLVDGGDKIKQFGWENVRGYLAVGGTTIGTARCVPFRTREGRLKATYNLIKNGIDALVIVGGDGSLTGADILRAEWTGLVDELVATGRVTKAECAHLREDLAIVGLVGSIDNDMSATDITIGAVTSLHRICESVDSLTSTAQSHQRAFVVEVMGRHCGWLGLMAGIAVGADWVCLPERPPPLNQEKYGDDWGQEMADIVGQYRTMGSRKSIIIVCEGAIDRNLKPIKPDEVKKVLEDKLGLDTRVTTLGHVQRGGSPCAFDRYLATVQGVEAVEAVLRSTRDTPAPMIGMSQNMVISVPLMDAVKLTHSVAEAISRRDFKLAMDLRDPDFTSAFDTYIESTLLGGPGKHEIPEIKRLRIGIIHCGAPAGGMNAATRIAARLCLNRGHTPLAIRNGFSGLVNDEVRPIQWQELFGWQVRGGSELGTNRNHPHPMPNSSIKISPKGVENFIDLGQIAFHLQKHNIEALLVIGGFEAYTAQAILTEARGMYPAFAIPMVHLPATVSNNVPGTDYSIGCDTALNVIVDSCDRLKQSANASRKRVFVVEVQGGTCGFLATLGGLTAGATNVYIPEQNLGIKTLEQDIDHLCRRYEDDKAHGNVSEGRVILRTELTKPDVYSTEVIAGILRAESMGLFDARTAVLGHLQQGGVPTPLDRIRATRLAVKCVDWLEDVAAEIRAGAAADGASTAKLAHMSIFTTNPEHSAVIGIRGAAVVLSPVLDLLKEVDLKARRTKNAWWMGLGRLVRVLSKYEYCE